MAYDHAEQEQLASLKAWWSQYGNLVTWVLIIALGAYAAWAGWNYYQRNQSAQASGLYMELQNAVAAKDNAKVQRAASDLTERFGRTAYADMAALVAARSAFDANDTKTARAHLERLIAKGQGDEYKWLARIRLAGLLLDEKAYDEGMKLLSGTVPEQFASLAADRKGDILVAQDKLQEARAAYQQALEKTGQDDPARQLIQMKLDAIGGASTAAAG